MSSESPRNLSLEIAHVLFIDIVGYSKLLTSEQRERQRELNAIVRETEPFRAAEADGKLVRIPTGDGMVLAFFTKPDAPARCAMAISRALHGTTHLPLRMGIHSGPVELVEDVNDKPNLAGAGVNIAQRVMDCGDAGHILLSARAADDLAEHAEWNAQLHELGEIEVKHGVRVGVVSLHSDEVGNVELPQRLRRQQLVRQRRLLIVAGAAAVLILSTAAGMWFWQRQAQLRAQVAAEAEAVATRVKSVAVLPFENLSTEEENAAFAGGVHREVLSNLGKVNDLKVISRTSVMQYTAGAARNLKEIARELGVSHVVEGSVQRAGARVRVIAQLIDARTDAHLWGETFDRELSDVFAIQSEIAQRISTQLGARLSPQERTALTSKPTQNVEAFDHYIQARALMETSPDDFVYEENVTKAVGLLEQAVAKDQQFSLAYSTLAEANIQLFRARRDPKYLAQANAALQEAHRLAPEAGETHLAQALFYYYGQNDFDRALATLEVAARSLPNNAQVFELRGLLERRMGRWEESLRHFKQAIELDPKDHNLYGHASGGAVALRRNEEAHRIREAAIAAFPTEADTFRAWKGLNALWGKGDTEAARRELEKIRKKVDQPSVMLGFLVPFYERNYAEAEEAMKDFAKEKAHPDDFLEFLPRLAVATNTVEKQRASLLAALARTTEVIANEPDGYPGLKNGALLNAALGNKEEAIRVAKRAVELYPVSRDALVGPEQLSTLATIYAWMGEKDLAFETLFTLVNVPRGLDYGELKLEPAWDNLRDDPRFEALVAQAAKPLG